MDTEAQWDKAAAGWNAHSDKVRRWLRGSTDAMIEMAGITEGAAVLDVAAGAGDQTLDIAARVGPNGSVTASDISAGILAHAAENARAAGYHNVTTHQADLADLGLPAASFDAATCRLGLMFLPDPAVGLASVYKALKPKARFCAMVFAGPQANPCLRILMSTAMKHAGLPPRDPFTPGGLVSLGKPGLMDALFRDAGLRAVATTEMDAPFSLPTTADYLAFIRDAAGPIKALLGSLDATAQAAAWADMEAQLGVFQTPEGWVGPNTLLLTVGEV